MKYFLIILLSSVKLFASEVSYLIEFNSAPTSVQIAEVKELSGAKSVYLFDTYPSVYFKRLYKLNSNELTIERLVKISNLSFVSSIEQSRGVKALSIVPSKKIPTYNDPFYNYQWALDNSGQVVFKDIDDIHLKRLESRLGMDLGLKEAAQIINEKLKRNVTIAVLDSGVDINHPDIRENIYKNEQECKTDGRVPTKPKEDKDNNGYLGDCKGWNFTAKSEEGNNRVSDRIGHGTHVAGLIAAQTGNHVGISGISNKIKILPIKVLHKSEGKKSKVALGLADRVAKGVLYAIKMKVDVIHLSLGWPRGVDSQFLRESFAEAERQNIIVVAAAGNNNNDQQIYPCAYASVICVGSINLDGQVSEFSNFGGHVDVLAPGDNILSLYPEVEEPLHFSVQGYEVKNGTSQAAPFVSALAGILKGLGVKNNFTVKARIFSTTAPVKSENKNFQYGLIRFDKALVANDPALVQISFKDFAPVRVNSQDRGFIVSLPVQNLGSLKEHVEVTVSTNDSNFQFIKAHQELVLNSNQEQMLTFKGRVTDIGSESVVKINVKVKTNTQTRVFSHSLRLSMSLESAEKINLKIYDIDNENINLFRTIKTINSNKMEFPHFYIKRKLENGQYEIKIYKIVNNYYKYINSIFLNNAQDILNVYRVDVNLDGSLDYWVRSIHKAETRWIQYSYFNDKLEPLFGDLSFWKFEPEVVILPVNDMHFVKYNFSKLGEVLVPVFLKNGRIPLADQNPNDFENEGHSKFKNIYYLEPVFDNSLVKFVTRVFNRFDFKDLLIKKYNLSHRGSIEPIHIISGSDTNSIDILLSVGEGFSKSYYKLTLNSESLKSRDFQISPFDTSGQRYEGHQLKTIITPEPQRHSEVSMVGFFGSTSIRVSNVDQQGLESSYIINYEDKNDHILGYLASYKWPDKRVSLFQTKNHLVAASVGANGKITMNRKPINRFSFLRGYALTELFVPILKGSYGVSAQPAVYVDTTQVSSSYIYSWYLGALGGIKTAINLTIDIPENCRSLNPTQNEIGYYYSVICGGSEGNRILFIPVR